jgi:hypothetical protein
MCQQQMSTEIASECEAHIEKIFLLFSLIFCHIDCALEKVFIGFIDYLELKLVGVCLCRWQHHERIINIKYDSYHNNHDLLLLFILLVINFMTI